MDLTIRKMLQHFINEAEERAKFHTVTANANASEARRCRAASEMVLRALYEGREPGEIIVPDAVSVPRKIAVSKPKSTTSSQPKAPTREQLEKRIKSSGPKISAHIMARRIDAAYPKDTQIVPGCKFIAYEGLRPFLCPGVSESMDAYAKRLSSYAAVLFTKYGITLDTDNDIDEELRVAEFLFYGQQHIPVTPWPGMPLDGSRFVPKRKHDDSASSSPQGSPQPQSLNDKIAEIKRQKIQAQRQAEAADKAKMDAEIAKLEEDSRIASEDLQAIMGQVMGQDAVHDMPTFDLSSYLAPTSPVPNSPPFQQSFARTNTFLEPSQMSMFNHQ